MQITPELHITMLCLTLLLVLIALFFGKRAKNADRLNEYSRTLGIIILMLWVGYSGYNLMPANFSWRSSLPIEVCDVAAIFAGLVMFNPTKVNRCVLYFAGFGLTTQAFLTPGGNQDPASLRFWFFWGLHAGIMACAVFDVVIREYRPKFSDYLMGVTVDLIYIGIIFPLNIFLNWNYGYMGDTAPGEASTLDFIGKWPDRVLIMVIATIIFQGFLYAVWHMHTAAKYVLLRSK